jgi:ArsR family transcriptional regulator
VKDYLNIFKALSDENRLRILLMLRVRPLCVCEINEVLNIALSTISAHLRLMKNTGLIEDRKDGRWVIYSLAGDNILLNNLLESMENRMQTDTVFLRDRSAVAVLSREICAARLKEKA